MIRRDFVKLGLLGAGTLALSPFEFATATATEPPWAAKLTADPHFFLMIVLNGAADPSYMFDARPLSMTKAGKIQNYWSKNNQEPTPWTGVNGQTCLSTPLIKPLEPYRNKFSVLNGVVMSPSFDGHLQNMNFLFCGGPFGGDSFMPHLNLPETGLTPDSLDGINVGQSLEASIENHSNMVPLTPESVAGFEARLKKVAQPAPGSELMDFIGKRMSALSSGTGRFSKGSRMMSEGLAGAPGLHGQLIKLQEPNIKDNEQRQAISLVSDCFRNGIARSALYTLPEFFDTHAAEAAQNQPQLFTDALTKVAEVFKALNEISFDSTRSMFDVTTVLVSSEMGRTLRVDGEPINDTGTNHNQYCNSMIIGGKGIKAGLVIGASDFSNENDSLSKAHLQIDAIQEKAVGRPFDFTTMKARTDLPEKFEIQDYLTVGSVINTVYTSFNMPAARLRTLGRGLPVAPVLKGLLV